MIQVQVDQLSLSYSGQPHKALDGVSLQLQAGEMVLVSGPTGCGKSSLGLVLCGAIPNLLPAQLSGSLVLAQGPLQDRPIHDIARDLGLLMQNVEQQTFTERVEDEIAFGLENFCVPKEEIQARILEALALVDAQHLLDRNLAELSAGERQRVMLAALLALRQKVLILDEPLAYLDQAAQKQLMEVLTRLTQQGRAVLLFEHRRDMVKSAVHREIYLHQGVLTKAPKENTAFQRIQQYKPAQVVLHCDHLSFAWAAQGPPLLHDFSLQVHAHESLVLLGSNGCGKTSLMALIAGLMQPQAGEIRVCGMNALTRSPAALAQEVSFIFQHPDHQLFLPSVQEEIQSQTKDAATAQQELEAMGLEGLEHRHPRSLSMGQKRRLTIAAALARKPKLLLLDEPSVGQDDRNLDRIIRRLDRFLAAGGALLTATHDARVATALAARVVNFLPQ